MQKARQRSRGLKDGLPDGSGEPIVFQINHARSIEPKAHENYFTKDDRLFPAVRVVDPTGMLELRMREKRRSALRELVARLNSQT